MLNKDQNTIGGYFESDETLHLKRLNISKLHAITALFMWTFFLSPHRKTDKQHPTGSVGAGGVPGRLRHRLLVLGGSKRPPIPRGDHGPHALCGRGGEGLLSGKFIFRHI